MRLEAPTLHALAERAGFVRPELPVAVAIALVASGGHPHHDHPVGAPGTGRYVGLWGIDVDRWGDYDAESLYDPWAAAQAAYALTRRNDGFGWSAHWRAGTDRAHYETAISAAAARPYRDTEYLPVMSTLYGQRLAHLAERNAERIVRATQWPITSSS